MKYYILKLIFLILAFCVAHSGMDLSSLGIPQYLGNDYSTVTLLIVLAKAIGQFILILVIPIIKLITALVDLIRSTRKNKNENNDSKSEKHKKH